MEFYKAAVRWLRQSGLQVSNGFLRNRMQSHPDYPAMVALTDTLDELRVDYSAFIADKDRYNELSYPILAHLQSGGREGMQIIVSPNSFSKNTSGILEKWDGVCLQLNKGAAIQNEEHALKLKTEKTEQRKVLYAVMVSVLLFAGIVFFSFSAPGFLLQLLSMAGAGMCALIVMHSMGKGNAITEQLCTAEGSGCNKVLQSKAAKWKGISAGETGMVYFAGLVLCFTLAQLQGNLNATVSLAAFPIGTGVLVSIISVYYQWKIVKSWCRMCLLVSAVLWFQAIIWLAMVWKNTGFELSVIPVAVFCVSSIIAGLVWILIKPLIKQGDKAEQNEIKALKLKRNPAIFIPFLKRQRHVDITPWEHDIVLGNRETPVQLLVACNPYCGPCEKAHAGLEQLLKTYPDTLSITIRFTVSTVNMESDNTQAVLWIINAFNNGNTKAVDRWFEIMDLEKYKELYPAILDEKEWLPLLQQHEEWTGTNPIFHTPTLFVNGHEWASPYNIYDLKLAISQLIENVAESEFLMNTKR